MDIFTTQLAHVRQTPIKPERLKVKALNKESHAKALNEEQDHLTGESHLSEIRVQPSGFENQSDEKAATHNDLKEFDNKNMMDDNCNVNTEKENKVTKTEHLDIYI